jgi:hypothetical protein
MDLDVTSAPKSKGKDALQVRGQCRPKLHLRAQMSTGKELTMRPLRASQKLSAYEANTVSKDRTGGERKQNVNCRLELSHELHFVISIPKVVECLRFFLKNVKYCIGRTATSELGGDRIRDNVLPRLLGVLLQGSIENSLELRRRCVQGGIRGHNADTKTRWTTLNVEVRTCWGCTCLHCPKYNTITGIKATGVCTRYSSSAASFL